MRHSKSYRKYSWVGNQISSDDMAALYKMKQKTKRHITALVAEAVSRYIKEGGSMIEIHQLDNDKCQTCSQCWTGRCHCPEFKAALREFRKDTVHEMAKQILVIE